MSDAVVISGFADEISADFDEQIETVKALGMDHLCVRAADGVGIVGYTEATATTQLLPRLQAAGIGVSSLGSPIGKIDMNDEAGFVRQLDEMETLCRIAGLLGCRFIRVFSFYVPAGEDADRYGPAVIAKLRQLTAVAADHGITLLHENEKGIFGDTAARGRLLLEAVGSPHFRAAFDFANFVQCGEDPMRSWHLLQHHVAYFHIKDARFDTPGNVLCGTGDGNIPEILRAAISNGYRGFLTLEPHLAEFATFAGLERVANPPPDDPLSSTGATAYAAQYNALRGILRDIPIR